MILDRTPLARSHDDALIGLGPRLPILQRLQIRLQILHLQHRLIPRDVGRILHRVGVRLRINIVCLWGI